MIPKTDKLVAEESVGYNFDGPTAYVEHKVPAVHDQQIRDIKELHVLNDFVAIWQEPLESGIILGDKEKYKDEGLVVGVGPKVEHVKVGDFVAFTNRVITSINPTDGFYADERILLICEHSCLMVLKKIQVNRVSE